MLGIENILPSPNIPIIPFRNIVQIFKGLVYFDIKKEYITFRKLLHSLGVLPCFC